MQISFELRHQVVRVTSLISEISFLHKILGVNIKTLLKLRTDGGTSDYHPALLLAILAQRNILSRAEMGSEPAQTQTQP